jgi:hypothetical protein
MKPTVGITLPEKAQVLKGSLLEIIVSFLTNLFRRISLFFGF